jgi:hypothetical protein
MPARVAATNRCWHLWRPQPTRATCTVLADLVHLAFITGPARPAMPRARHHQTQHQSEESQKRTP